MIKINGREVTNPIAQAFWSVIALMITFSTLTFVFGIVLLVLALIFSPIWLPVVLTIILVK